MSTSRDVSHQLQRGNVPANDDNSHSVVADQFSTKVARWSTKIANYLYKSVIRKYNNYIERLLDNECIIYAVIIIHNGRFRFLSSSRQKSKVDRNNSARLPTDR